MLDSLDTLMESLAPPVVVVIVTHDPGPWLETALQAIGEQDYPEVSVLVLDAASSEDPTSRVASVLPDAFVRRLDANDGFGPTANQAASMVEGADFLLFCHDDVAPEPEAVRHMVEEAYRSNAGVVGPKFVDWNDPERILHVGVQVDKSGAVVDRVERGEVDHGQHDAVRDVFSTPGGFTLVRSDLFAELGGFDPHIVVMGEDLDLCWRAQIAGARVIVAPDARVRHLELLASGNRSAPTGSGQLVAGLSTAGDPSHPDSAKGQRKEERPVTIHEFQRRAELHATLKAYGPLHRVRVLPQVAALALAEMIVLVAVRRASRAAEVAGAWRWNFRIRRATRLERIEVQRIRRVSDSEVRTGQIRGSARVSRYLRLAFTQGLQAARLGVDDAVIGPASARSAGGARVRPRFRRPTPRVIAWIAMFVVLAFGARELLSGGLPVVGQLLRVPAPGSLLSQFVSGRHQFGSSTADAATPATLVLGLAGYVLFGSVGFLQTLLVVGCLPLGAFGAARLCRRFAAGWTPIVGAACYLAVPLPYDDIATGREEALFAYAVIPWMMLALSRASGLDPLARHVASPVRPPSRGARRARTGFGRGGVGTGSPGTDRLVLSVLAERVRPLLAVLTLGLAEAVLIAFDPPAVFVTLVLGIGLSLGILVTTGQGALRAAGRVAATTIGALATAVVLLAPWSISVLAGSAPLDVIAGTRPGPYTNVGWGGLLRMAPGPIGVTPLVWGLLAAAALPLLIGRSWRLSWAGRMWVCSLTAWLISLCAQHGWLGSAAVLPAQLLPIAACGLACSTALGVTAFSLDLPASRFGWRQVVSALAGCAAVVGALPAIAATGGGRFDLPQTGYSEVLSWMSSVPAAGSSGVLWLGDGAVVPGKAWPLQPGLDYSVSAGGIPDLTAVWQGPPSVPGTEAASDIALAVSGRTVELGHLLAAHSIQYVVVVGALAPAVPGLQQPPVVAPQPALLAALDAQDDLRQLPTQGGYEVFEDPEFVAPSSQAAVRAPAANGFAVAIELILWAAVCAGLITSRRRRSKRISPGGHGERLAGTQPGGPEGPRASRSSEAPTALGWSTGQTGSGSVDDSESRAAERERSGSGAPPEVKDEETLPGSVGPEDRNAGRGRERRSARRSARTVTSPSGTETS